MREKERSEELAVKKKIDERHESVSHSYKVTSAKKWSMNEELIRLQNSNKSIWNNDETIVKLHFTGKISKVLGTYHGTVQSHMTLMKTLRAKHISLESKCSSSLVEMKMNSALKSYGCAL